jgi:alpha-L-fucosidase
MAMAGYKRKITGLQKTMAWLMLWLTAAITGSGQGLQVQVADSGFVFAEAPTAACHASTIVHVGHDTMLVAWFGGQHEGATDVAIWMARRVNNTWSKPLKVATGVQPDGQSLACWNPVLYKTRSGLLMLFYKVGTSPRSWWGMVQTSTDNGHNWSDPRRLPPGILGPIKNKPLQLANGNLLCPSSTESEDEKIWAIHVETCDSTGQYWQKTAINCDSFGVIQPSVLQYPDGRLQLLSRSRQNRIIETWSADAGKSWQPLQPTQLPNPNSGSDAVSLPNGYQLLVYNPLLAGKNWWEGRSVLRLAASGDGATWTDLFTFENQTSGEYSYPAIVADPDGCIWVTYTWQRKHIKWFKLKLSPLATKRGG